MLVTSLVLSACSVDPPAPVVDLSAGAVRDSRLMTPAASSASVSSGTYSVVRGDTLYAIAFKHGIDFRQLAAWNSIEPPYRIFVGQELKLEARQGASSEPLRSSVAGAAVAAHPVSAAAPPAPTSRAGMFEDVKAEPPEAASPKPAPKASSEAITGPTAATQREQAMPITAKPATPETAPKASQVAPAATVTQASKPLAADPAPIAEDSVVTSANGVAWRWPGKGSLIGTYVAGDQTRQGIDVAGKAGDPVLAAADGEVVYSGNGLLGYGELIIVKHNANFLSAYGHNRKRLVQEGDRIKGGQQIAEMGSSASSRDELHFEIRKNGKPVNPLDYLPAR